MIRILSIIHGTTVDGPGLRTSLYAAGCTHHCPGCHNPQSWDPWGGDPYTEEQLLADILSDPFAHVTFTGGDPMHQAQAFTQLAKKIHQQSSKTIWCYTGYTIEQILQNPIHKALAEQCEVIVDGPYIQALRDESLLFRGSSNQRLIHIPATLATGQITLWQSPI